MDQVTETLTPGNQLAAETLECRLTFETSDSREICDAGRRMIVEKESETHGRVIFIGFEPGKSTESGCVVLQRCLRDVFAGALLRWPEGYEGTYLVYGQAPYTPGFHPKILDVPYRERYVRLLASAQEHLDLYFDILKEIEVDPEIDLDELSEEKRFNLEYEGITAVGKKHDAEMMLRAIDSRTGTP